MVAGLPKDGDGRVVPIPLSALLFRLTIPAYFCWDFLF